MGMDVSLTPIQHSRMDEIKFLAESPRLLNVVDFEVHIRWDPIYELIFTRFERSDLPSRLNWTEVIA